jgi:hypothetical protein
MNEPKRPADRQFNFTAWFSFKGEEYLHHFNNYFEAVEWCFIRLENIGERKEWFARGKVERAGGIVWEMPETVSKKENPFGFAQYIVK